MKKIIFALSTLFMFASCEQVIEYELPDPGTKLTMHAILEGGDTIKVICGSSSYVLSSSLPGSDSTYDVSLFENGAFVEKLRPFPFDTYERYTYINGGERIETVTVYGYKGNTIAQSGSSYRIEVNVPELDLLQGSNPIPGVPLVELTSGDTTAGQYEFEITQSGNVGDAYQIEVFQTQTFQQGSQTVTRNEPVFMIINDPTVQVLDNFSDPFDPDPQGVFTQKAYVSNEFFTGGKKRVSFVVAEEFGGPEPNSGKLMLKISKITPDYFQFEQSKSAYFNYIELFSEPAQLYSNVQGGYGIVAGASPVLVELKEK